MHRAFLLPPYRSSSLKYLVVFLLPWLLTGCGDPWLMMRINDPIFLFFGQAFPSNLHELDPGKAYRSAQPTGDELKNAINILGLKTVMNLRGSNPGEDWYDQEVDTCRQMSVTLASYPMDAGFLPSPDTLQGIINTLKNGQYPILIHCAGGVDRTGAISAIYRMLINGDEKSVALQQLGPSKASAMHALAEMYEPTDDWLTYYTQNYDNLTVH